VTVLPAPPIGDFARYKVLFDEARDIIIVARATDSRILEANRAACDAYGYSCEELRQLTTDDLCALNRFANGIADDRHSERRVLVESLHRRKDGSIFPVAVAEKRLTLGDDLVNVQIVRDLSDRQQARRELDAAFCQAVDALKQKSDFVATMSHEIRTPMNAIIGMAELLLTTHLDDRQRTYALTVREQGEALLLLLNDILDVAKIEAGKMEVRTGEFDIAELVESTASVLAPQAHQKKLSLMTFVDPDIPPMLLGDAGRLRQVLINLAGNAIKFTDTGHVLISAIARGRALHNCRVEFSVQDTGIGLSEGVKATLFQPFRQGDASASRQYGGTGLGLSISQRLVHLMGGSIGAKSVLGEGSTFTFELALPVAEEPKPNTPPSGIPTRILLLTKDAWWSNTITRYAASWSIICSTAHTPGEVVDMLEASRKRGIEYDAVLIDTKPPHAAARSLANKIGNESSTRLVLISRFESAGRMRRSERHGRATRLVMPVRRSELLDSILGNRRIAPTQEPIPPADEKTAHAMYILVVEDNAVNRRLALEQLHFLGHRARAVFNGRRAVAAAASHGYDLILMDCHMPGMDGFAATRAIRAAEARCGRHTRIIAMTATASETDRAACLAAGMDGYLAKPVTLDRLREALIRSTDRRDASAASVPIPQEPAYEDLNSNHLVDIFNGSVAAANAFLRSALPELSSLVRTLSGSDTRDERARIAHELKGVAANLGAQRLANAASALQHNLESGACEAAALQSVRASMEALTMIIKMRYGSER